MEETLLGVMYEVPSRKEVERVVITPEVVLKESLPTYINRGAGPKRAAKGEKRDEEKSA